MPPGDNKFRVFLTFKDEATGKFMKATNSQINSIKKLGVQIKKTGSAAQIDMQKMATSQTSAGRASRFHGRMITELQGKIGSLRNIMLLYFFAMRPLMKLYKETTEAAIKQQNAELKLAAAFAATKRGSISGRQAIISYAAEMQELTGFGDEEIISSAALLANYKLTEGQILKVIPVMLDMTAALKAGGSESANVESIAKRLGLAFTGQASFLKRYGIIIDNTTAKFGSFDDILHAIESSVAGTAEAMALSFEGQRNIFRAAIGDYREQLGMVITQSPVVIASMKLIGEAIKQNTANLLASREATDNFVSSWERVAAAVIGVTEVIKFLWRAFFQGLRVIATGIFKLSESLMNLTIRIAEVGKQWAELNPLVKGLADRFQAIIDKNKEWSEVSRIAADNMVKDMQFAAEEMGNPINHMINQHEKLMVAVGEASRVQADSIKGLVDSAETDIVKTYAGMTVLTKSFAVGMRDAISSGFIKIVKRDFEGLKDVIVTFGDTMLKTISQIIANLILMTVWKHAAGFLGFAGVAPGSAGPITVHSGGYAMNLDNSFGYSKRYHSGGEVQATLLEGEGVVSRRGMENLGVDNLNRLNRGEGMSGGKIINNYYIQTIDERSFRERLQQHGDIYAGATELSIKDNSSLRKTSQKWG